jgi:hypothetical protein
MKIYPQQDYLLLQICDLPSEQGIALPEGSVREPYGHVISVGPNCKFVKEGDNVLFFPSSAIRFDEDRAVIGEASIFAKCDPESIQNERAENVISMSAENTQEPKS